MPSGPGRWTAIAGRTALPAGAGAGDLGCSNQRLAQGRWEPEPSPRSTGERDQAMTYPESERPPEPERQPSYASEPGSATESRERRERGGSRWTGGRIASLVIGSVLALLAVALLVVGTIALVIDQTQRDDDDFISFGTERYSTSGYAIASDRIDLRGVDWDTVNSWIGDVRVRATPVGGGQPVFVGIGPADAVEQYLGGVEHTIVRDLEAGGDDRETIQGGPPQAPPEQAGIWAVEVSGPGTQDLIFPAVDGEWALVAMNQDASAGVDVRAQVSATLPSLFEFAIWCLVIGAVLLAIALVLIIIPARRASADRRRPGPPPEVEYAG